MSAAGGAAEPAGFTGPVRTFAVPVERGTVAAFCQAVGEPDETSVPPTFAVVADRFDPEFPRRPPSGRGWEGGLPPTVLHVEQWFELGPPLQVGDELVAHRGPGRRWEREGRSGRLTFVEERTELHDADGARRVATGWVDVHAEAAHRDLTAAQAAPAGEEAGRPVVGPGPDEVVVVEGLTPTQLVRYVGATGDLHPLHHDQAMAQALGYRSVFAPGMLTMALTARAVTAHLGGPVARLSSRFRSQVWPGDTLLVAVTDAGDGTVRARTRNQHGDVVLETEARGR